MDFLEDLQSYEESMKNAFLIVTRRKTVSDIYEQLEEGDDIEFYLPFNPMESDGRDVPTIELLLEYFEEMEEYEKCAELVKIKKCLKEQID